MKVVSLACPRWNKFHIVDREQQCNTNQLFYIHHTPVKALTERVHILHGVSDIDHAAYLVTAFHKGRGVVEHAKVCALATSLKIPDQINKQVFVIKKSFNQPVSCMFFLSLNF